MKLKEINLMNVFLCFCVIIIHLTSKPMIALNHDSIWYLIIFIINKFFSFSVPGFIFLSGFKLRNKYKNTKINSKEFLSRRLTKILIPYFISYCIYFLFFLSIKWISWNEFIPGLLLGTLVAHFYYIIIAFQLYLIFPILNSIFHRYNKILLFVSLISTILFHQFILFPYSDRFFGAYIFYFVLGMIFSENISTKNSNVKFYFQTIAFVTIAFLHIALSFQGSLGNLFYKYGEIMQITYSTLAIIIIYNICKKIDCSQINTLINFINPHTFNIYLYHIFIMNICYYKIYPHFALSIKQQFIITSLTVFTVFIIYCAFQKLIYKNHKNITQFLSNLFSPFADKKPK